ncbi:TonB-dependent receptor plug [Emticicia oligotrophica DSM 17448]|uniref:TonB-dependent receptor plug n=1 Tax=Emticicia oligotrophica (strain DSM 17448 / CIP 109782 / MTCC 6937 / GPTSA100-15) TaxID=929562 RepID=A0ABN4AIG7_EMTOG|nr:TonB-dependent receptor [Emticicia oligotrophica]AFK01888.1 TonB-dependent receptor plug [Emticicia oligotrophica DSM 17448]
MIISTRCRHLNKKFNVLLAMLFFTIFTNAIAQNVKGKISDDKGQGLPGVSVLVKGTNTGSISDVNGDYSIAAGKNTTLVISYIGFVTKEVPVNGRSVIDVALETDTKALSEVVVVGYGTQKKVTVTGAVVAVQGEKIIKSPATDISNSLAGRLPGLVVIQTSGEPGNDGAKISIRGTNTLGNSSPLVVIDGIPDRDGGLGRLSPRDIESISVLKDASAAIYGARAANGAILVTTKRGKSGKPTISYDFNQGFSQPAMIPKMSSASEYAAIMNELPIYKSIPASEWSSAWQAIKTTGVYKSPTPGVSSLSANYSPEAVKGYAAGNDPWRYPNTDWFGDAFKTFSPQARHNLQLSGGTDAVKYMASLGYVSQDAYYKNSATNYKQYNFRTNLDAKVNKYINTNLGIMVRREDRRYPTEDAGAIFRMLMRGRPTEPEVWPNGMPGPDIENGQNPYVITTNATGYRQTPTDYIQANGGVNITNPWIDGLKLTLSGAIDRTSETTKVWQTPWSLYYWDKKSFEADGVTPKLEGAIRSNFKDPRLTQSYRSVLNTNLTAMLTYDKKINENNNLSALVGVTKEVFKGDNFLAYRRNYISPAIDQLFAGGSLQQNTDGSAYNRARLGYYGRLQYNYKEKYLIEGIYRYDGSYIFPEAKRFGFFPGLLIGWNLTNEDFFKVQGIDYLKIRASYGQMGNDQVFYNSRLQEYAFLSTYGFGRYPINNQVVTTLKETVLANPNFTWERANNYNVGLDGTFLNGKIDATLEYFYNRRDQILIQKTGSTPSSSGINSLLPPVNAGIVDNRGFEFNVGYNGKATQDLTFRAAINGGYAKNRVIFMDEIPGAPSYQLQEGKPINGFLVYKSDGVFKDAAAIDANKIDYSAVTSKLIPGDMKFVDYNGDGKITGDDQVRLDKNETPTFNFGATIDVRYKGFDLNILFQGAAGAAIRIQTESGDIGNFLKYSYDHRWTIDNPSSTDPRLASRGDTYYTGGNYGNNTYYLFSKDYIRLKNLELGYAIPSKFTDKVKLGNVRVYVNGLNLLTFSKNKIFDPEATAQSGVYYPQSRVINTGLSLSF